jgi:hypothetical protein
MILSLFQVRLLRYRYTDNGFICTVVVLRILLPRCVENSIYLYRAHPRNIVDDRLVVG